PAIAELPVTAGLLLVPALYVGLAAYGFPIRDLRSVQFHVDAVALLYASDDHLHVLLTAAGEQEFLGLRIAVEPQGLVLFENALHRVAEPVLILPALGRNRKRNRRLG